MPNIIEITNLQKTYQASKRSEMKHALNGVNLNIPKGMIYGLLGPNGAGKSSLINILAGLALKTSGSVTVAGVDLDEDPRGVRRALGVVPQEVMLDPFFTIRESLEYHAGYYGVPASERRTDEILAALSLSDKADVKSRRLSGGMKRRVLIAKALVHNPDILILDEPTAGVDVELRINLWEYVRELNERGTTILLTTHYLEEAEELCERIAIINHGEIVVEGRTADLKGELDHKKLIITVAEKLSEVPAIFASNDQVEAKISGEQELVLSYHSREICIGDLFDLTSKAGLTIKDISTEQADLEDIFRMYVDGDDVKKDQVG
jgi:ABC-2 type transport system ATP-binding protein